jgi:hypothetical protein
MTTLLKKYSNEYSKERIEKMKRNSKLQKKKENKGRTKQN